MKIVINKCYGGFGVSVEATKLLVTRGCKAVEDVDEVAYHGGQAAWDENKKRAPSVYDRPRVDIGDGYTAESWGGRDTWPPIFKDGRALSFDDSKRDDPDLVAVVEQLGSIAASGPFAQLEVVEIPDGTEWEIDEYDGLESVEEKHRSWG